jgi:hypothetical protein
MSTWKTAAAVGLSLIFVGCSSTPTFAQRPPLPATAAPATGGPASSTDPCGGAGTCYATSIFVADVTRVTTSRPSAGPVNATVVQRIDVRFRNISTKPIILVHRADSAKMVDNNGNPYWYWNPKANVTGIGFVGNATVDASFVIRPGESRNATFEQRFVYDARQKVPGNMLTFDLGVDEVEPVSAQQLKTVRKHAVGFSGLSAR